MKTVPNKMSMDVSAERAYPTPMVNSTLLPMLLLSLATQKHAPETSDEIDTEYDYIVVGAGSAGSVIASRLSEISCLKVLLLEAGGPPPLLTEVPAFSEYFRGSDIDFNYKTVPQNHVGNGLINRQLPYYSGKGLGGSSILNNMMYVRGNKRDYDQWAAEGAKGWSYKDVFPYFKKMEDNRDQNYILNGFHGEGGPVSVHQPRYRSEWVEPLFKTIKSMGYKVDDPNGATQTGFYDIQNTLRSGQRCSTAKAYLVPAENRTNLDILPYAMVRKILIKDNQAIGVQFDYGNETYEVKARREVILSAGTIKTAQLLKLSGIGPRKELEKFHIPVIADLPVGLNLQDHPVSFTNFLLGRNVPQMNKKLQDPKNIHLYIQNRTGPLTSPGISAAVFVGSSFKDPTIDFPSYLLTFSESQHYYPLHAGLNEKYISRVYKPYKGRSFYTCYCFLLHPRSRGSVTLQSADPYDSPLIDPNYLKDPKDIQELIEGFKTCLRIGKNPIMRRMGSIPFQTLVPGCEKYSENENTYLECAVKSAIITFSHGVGTARMGDLKDPRTVVDPHLKVLHVRGLRVVDASVMPNIPSGDPYIPSIMIAEKASDIIKSEIECLKKDEDDREETVNSRRSSETFDNSVQSYYKQQNSNHESSKQNADSIRSLDPPYNPAPSESRRKKPSTVRSPESQNVGHASHEDSHNSNWEENDELDNTLHEHELHKVTPWNKEIPNVIPWNQELLRANVLNTLPNQVSSSNQNSPSPGIQQTLSPGIGNNFLMSQLTNLFNIQRQQTQGISNLPQSQTQGTSSLTQPQLGGSVSQLQPQMLLTTILPQPQAVSNSGSLQPFRNVVPFQLPNNQPQQQTPASLPQQQIPASRPQTQLLANLPQQQMSVNLPQSQIPANLPQQQIPTNVFQQQTPANLAQQQMRSNLPPNQNPIDIPQQQLISVPQLQALVNSQQMQTFLSNPQLQSLFNNPNQQTSVNTLQTQTPNNLLQISNLLVGRIPYNSASPVQKAVNQPFSSSSTFHTGNSDAVYLVNKPLTSSDGFQAGNDKTHSLVNQPLPTSKIIYAGNSNTQHLVNRPRSSSNTNHAEKSKTQHLVNQPLSTSKTFHTGNFKTQNSVNLPLSSSNTFRLENSNTQHLDYTQKKKQWEAKPSPWQSVWSQGQKHVVPWNKEIPNVTPWNRELLQSEPFIRNQLMSQATRPSTPNQIISGMQNTGQGTSTAQGTATPQQSQASLNPSVSPQIPSPQSQTNVISQIGNGRQIPADLAENLRQLQQNLETQIPLMAGRQQFMQNLLDTVRQMLNLLSSNPSVFSLRSDSPLNRKNVCRFLFENMQCGEVACQNAKVLSTYMHNQLCT